VRIDLLDVEDAEQTEFAYYFHASSFDKGASFTVRTIYSHSASGPDETSNLENPVKAFVKLEL